MSTSAASSEEEFILGRRIRTFRVVYPFFTSDCPSNLTLHARVREHGGRAIFSWRPRQSQNSAETTSAHIRVIVEHLV